MFARKDTSSVIVFCGMVILGVGGGRIIVDYACCDEPMESVSLTRGKDRMKSFDLLKTQLEMEKSGWRLITVHPVDKVETGKLIQGKTGAAEVALEYLWIVPEMHASRTIDSVNKTAQFSYIRPAYEVFNFRATSGHVRTIRLSLRPITVEKTPKHPTLTVSAEVGPGTTILVIPIQKAVYVIDKKMGTKKLYFTDVVTTAMFRKRTGEGDGKQESERRGGKENGKGERATRLSIDLK